MMNCPPLATVIHFGLASAPCAGGQGRPSANCGRWPALPYRRSNVPSTQITDRRALRMSVGSSTLEGTLVAAD